MKNKTNIDEWSYFHLGVSVLGYAGDEASNIHEKKIIRKISSNNFKPSVRNSYFCEIVNCLSKQRR